MTEKVKLASIGLGWWGGVLADAAKRTGLVEIVSCYARTESTRQAFAEKYGCRPVASPEEILKDPEIDGLLTATPHSHHPQLIIAAASAGKHIFVEKPLTLTVAEAKKAIEATQKAKVVLQVGHHRRQGANRRIREMIDHGELGAVHQLEGNLSVFKQQPPTWRSDAKEQPLGGLTGLGVHMIDTLHYFAGPMKRVFCFSKKVLGRQGDIDEATVVAVEFENGPLGYIGFSLSVPKVCTVTAFGHEASAWSEEEGARLYFQKNNEFTRTELPVEAGDALADEIAEFARSIRGEATPETGGPEGLAVAEVMEALYESHKTGRAVDVADFC